MAQAQKLQMQQILGLSLTPEMRASLEILQFSAPRLIEFVAKEVEENPFLELDPDWAKRSRESGDYGSQKSGLDISEIEGTLKRGVTLTDHILGQVPLLGLTGPQHQIADYLLGDLNKAGYLQSPLDEGAQTLGVSLSEVEETLGKLQTLDPVGIFSRDLGECLSLQAKELGSRKCLKILDYLDLVANRDFEALKTRTGLNEEALQKAVLELRELDPKPGERFAESDPMQIRVADVLVKPNPKGDFTVELNPETLPKILIDETYSSEFEKKRLKKKEVDFLKTNKRRAGWLKRALDQRAKTLLRISEGVVKYQEDFFKKGVSGLRPLVLREIAEEVGVHQSTVSRVVGNKNLFYAHTVYPLRFFFSSGVSGGKGEAGVSSLAIKEKIKNLIAKESPKAPLSDEKLAKLLKSEGINIARRTVMKYREALGVPSSSKRRQK